MWYAIHDTMYLEPASYNATQRNAIRCHAMRCGAVRCSAIHRTAPQCNAMQRIVTAPFCPTPLLINYQVGRWSKLLQHDVVLGTRIPVTRIQLWIDDRIPVADSFTHWMLATPMGIVLILHWTTPTCSRTAWSSWLSDACESDMTSGGYGQSPY